MKKRYTIKQLKRWYNPELDQIKKEFIKNYEYQTRIEIPIKFKNQIFSNELLISILQLKDLLIPLVTGEIGKIFNAKLILTKSKKDKIIVKIDKLIHK